MVGFNLSCAKLMGFEKVTPLLVWLADGSGVFVIKSLGFWSVYVNGANVVFDAGVVVFVVLVLVVPSPSIISILSVLVILLSYTNYNLLKKNEKCEDIITTYEKYMVNISNMIKDSDKRLKENIVTIDSALEKVESIRGVYYNRIDDDTKRRKVGVIAQEVELVLPEVVHTGKDEIKGVDYGNMVGLLIESVKELSSTVKSLSSTVKGLQGTV
jgi:hypothetical protein